MRSIARANRLEPGELDPLLRQLPPPVGAAQPAHHPGLLAAASILLSLAVAALVLSLIPVPAGRAATVALGVGLLLAPYAHNAMRAPGDPTPVGVLLAPTLLGAGILAVLLAPTSLVAVLLPAAFAVPILARVILILRRGRPVVPALRNLEALARSEKLARTLRAAAFITVGVLLVWEALAIVLGGVSALPGPSARLWTGFLITALLLAGAWASLGPGQRDRREDWASLHKEDVRRRRAHHLTILGRAEQRLAV